MPEGLNILSWIVIGLLAGAIAGWFVPGRERNGCIGTILIGVAGGLIGGWIWTELLGQDQAGGFLGALLIAVLGSAIVLLILRAIRGSD
ncbi:MAG TPA: GlsB/YeaQ/YmgE family stress response membrane protein [Candidatus Limnocylindria bacterium]|nr:GlsB/YeaQ/YmgE family stress response membrane protein [Candidatus Limnocylindria bacterium]